MKGSKKSFQFRSIAILLTVVVHVGLFAAISFNGKDTFWLKYLPEGWQSMLVEEQAENTAEIELEEDYPRP